MFASCETVKTLVVDGEDEEDEEVDEPFLVVGEAVGDINGVIEEEDTRDEAVVVQMVVVEFALDTTNHSMSRTDV